MTIIHVIVLRPTVKQENVKFKIFIFFVGTATQLGSHSTTTHPVNRTRRWYTVVTLLYDLCKWPHNFIFQPTSETN